MNKLLENIVSLSYGNVSHTLYYLNIFILILYTMVYQPELFSWFMNIYYVNLSDVHIFSVHKIRNLKGVLYYENF